MRTFDYDFLPAALEIQARPPSPIGRTLLWAIVAFFVLAVLWACIGKIDIVATAAGKIVPSEHVKVVQPLEAGVVHALHVREGQTVAAGELLIELDPTEAGADLSRLESEHRAARLESLRITALLAALADARRPGAGADRLIDTLGPEAGDGEFSPAEIARQEMVLQAELSGFDSTLAALDAEIGRRSAEQAAVERTVARLEATLPIVTERAEAVLRLEQQKMASRLSWLEVEQDRIETEQELAVQRHRLTETQAAVVSAKRERETAEAEFRRSRLTALVDAERRAEVLAQELVKARQRHGRQQLRAPVAGVVQQLSVHTLGGVVTPAQPLMAVVPQGDELEVEAWVSNKDVGFVDAGQAAEIKVETFPFTRYGTLDAEVRTLSPDAVSDERMGLVYATRVSMGRTVMEVDGKTVNLTPGMAVTVEIKTGKRRVIEFVLSPLLRGLRESARER